MRPASAPNRNETRHADELDDDERRNLRVPIDADLGAVDRRHPDDRLNAVVVEQERDEHQERVPASGAAPATSATPRPNRRGSRSDAVAAKTAQAHLGGSGTPRSSGIEKTSHQTPR